MRAHVNDIYGYTKSAFGLYSFRFTVQLFLRWPKCESIKIVWSIPSKNVHSVYVPIRERNYHKNVIWRNTASLVHPTCEMGKQYMQEVRIDRDMNFL